MLYCATLLTPHFSLLTLRTIRIVSHSSDSNVVVVEGNYKETSQILIITGLSSLLFISAITITSMLYNQSQARLLGASITGKLLQQTRDHTLTLTTLASLGLYRVPGKLATFKYVVWCVVCGGILVYNDVLGSYRHDLWSGGPSSQRSRCTSWWMPGRRTL